LRVGAPPGVRFLPAKAREKEDSRGNG